tara:strand:- start:425 stop:1141 length:717 start_codon:yes stop_codon:yes gene_type:complete
LKAIILGQYFGTHAGGAEKSTIAIAKQLEKSGYDITILCTENSEFENNNDITEFSKDFKFVIKNISYPKLPPFLKYFYVKFFSKVKLDKFFDDYNKIIVFDFWGKALISRYLSLKNFHKIDLYVRNEVDYLEYKNYQIGLKKLLWYLYAFIQAPFYFYYKFDTLKIAKYGNVYANSTFVSKRIYERLHVNSTVVLPFIEKKNLQINFNPKPRYITFFGDNRQKGLHIFLALSRIFQML